MNLRDLRILALLLLAFPLCSYAQALGDVARQLRSERQQSGCSHTKVITNEDIESREPAPAHEATAEAAKSEDGAKPESESGEEAKGTKNTKSTKIDPAKEREARELETEKRSEEINKTYLDRIAAVRTQLGTAQQELARLQRDQIESSNDFQRSYGTAPTVGAYEAQQRLFNEQIEAHRALISSLKSQLEDAEEAARHAGVPHATD